MSIIKVIIMKLIERGWFTQARILLGAPLSSKMKLLMKTVSLSKLSQTPKTTENSLLDYVLSNFKMVLYSPISFFIVAIMRETDMSTIKRLEKESSMIGWVKNSGLVRQWNLIKGLMRLSFRLMDKNKENSRLILLVSQKFTFKSQPFALTLF